MAIEIVRRVYDSNEGHYLSVAPSTEWPGNVILHTELSQEEWFGKLCLDLSSTFMRELGEALIDCADEIEK
jgi:hypothetical protein